MKEFVDSNVVVYGSDRSAADKWHAAGVLLRRLSIEECGAVSIQVLQEFHDVVTRKKKLEADTLAVIRELSEWHVFAPKAADVIAAIGLQETLRISFWDALIVHAAAASRCEVLWSEDMRAGMEWQGVTVRNPFA